MSREALLDENGLVTQIRTLRSDMAALRGTEQPFGSDSVQTFRIFSDDDYDIEVTYVQFRNRVVEVTFTPTSTDRLLGAVLDFTAVITYEPTDPVEWFIEPLLPVNGVSKWRIYLSGSNFFPTQWVRMKFYVSANSSGTTTATSLY